MASTFLIFSLYLLSLANCKIDSVIGLNGEYTGTFNRSAPNMKTKTSKITLKILDNKFTGTSSIANYPAICEGAFTVMESKLNVTNDCMFTANFDWSLIFKGEFEYDVLGSQLKIWRKYPGKKIDVYTLEKIKITK